MTEEELIASIESQMNKGVSRLKVDFSSKLPEGESVEKYHHGRCDVGSPWALGKAFDCDAVDEKLPAGANEGRKIAVFFPGMGYHKDKPLLYHCAKLAGQLGYKVFDIVYHDLPKKVLGDLSLTLKAADMAYAQAVKQLEALELKSGDTLLLAGKSIGTFIAAKYAEEHGLNARQIWYTPLEATFMYPAKNVIAFFGDKDPWSDPEKIKSLAEGCNIPLYIYEGCNHSLEKGRMIDDVRNLLDVMEKTAVFLENL